MPQTNRRGVTPQSLHPLWHRGYITVLREAGAQANTGRHLNPLIYEINFLGYCQLKSDNKENPWFLAMAQTDR